MALVELALTAFIINLPLGIWRSRVAKFSWRWYLAVHLSIPVIFFLRHRMGLSFAYVPISLLAAVAGQVLGGRVAPPMMAGAIDGVESAE